MGELMQMIVGAAGMACFGALLVCTFGFVWVITIAAKGARK